MTFQSSTGRPAGIAAAVAAAAAVGAAVALLPAVHSRWWLPAGVAAALGMHAGGARALKAVLSAVSPLASGAPESAGYERSVYGTPGTATGQVVALVLASGLVLGTAGTLGSGWLASLAFAVLAGAFALDLHRWERVAVSADWVWFQRGFGHRVHQVAIENIRDVSVLEEEAGGITLRHGTRHRLCRLMLRMADKRVVALPKTDAAAGLDAVEAVANHIRARQALMAGPEKRPPPVSPDPRDEDMQRALRRLRRAAAHPPKP